MGGVQQVEKLDHDADWVVSGHVDGREFDEFLTALNAVVDEAKLTFGPDGIATAAVGPANVSLIEAQMEIDGLDKQVTIGANVDALRQETEPLARLDGYGIELDSRDGVFRVTELGGRTVEVDLIDPNFIRDLPNLPNFDHEAEFTTESFRLKGKIGALAEEISAGTSWGRVRLTPKDGELYVEARNGPADEWEYGWSMEADVKPGDSKTWAGNYLRDVIGSFPAGVDVEVRLGPDVPMELEVSDSFYFAVAPTINNGDGNE